jgi:hypothetical protein
MNPDRWIFDQDCAFALDLETMLLADPAKIPFSTISTQGGHAAMSSMGA